MKIERRFTTKKEGPYKGINFVPRVSEIRNLDGKVIFHQDNIIVPDFWAQIAVDILAQKYFRKTGVPSGNGKTGGENDSRQVFHRLAFTWTGWGKRYNYFDTEADAEAFYDELCYMLAHQMGAPNSPQWFNTGLFDVYGISGPPQGHYFVNPETGTLEKSKSAYERSQPHACFILSINDNLVNDKGIMDLITREARLFKYGSGSGTNYSAVRGKNERLSGGGVSSGLLSFLKVGDRSASSIKSGGTTRRAAKMVCLDIDHPDIEDFIQWKVQEEYKVATMVTGSKIIKKHVDKIHKVLDTYKDADFLKDAFDPLNNKELYNAIQYAIKDHIPPLLIFQIIQLVKQGVTPMEITEYVTEWDQDAYNTISGQSSNNSVRLPDSFMEAVKNNEDITLLKRTDNTIAKTINAKELWEEIVYAAWKCADPGVQFHTTVNEWHTCPEDGEIRASNPCSEYMFLDDTACNLASLNLLCFYDTEKQHFKTENYIHAITLWTIVLEISVVMAQFPSREIAQKSYDYRTLGLGFANLGALLMVMGIPYDSEKGRSIASCLSALLTGQAYVTSALLAREHGVFSRFNANKNHMLKVIRNHRRAVYNMPKKEFESLHITPSGFNTELCPEELLKAAQTSWDRALEYGEKFGFRNAQVSVIAPTGTIGLVMGCDTTGVEPDFALVKFKKLAGGGNFKIINSSIPPALKHLGYSKNEITEIINYCLGHGTLNGISSITFNALKEKGFTAEALQKIENGLKNTFSLVTAFQESVLGREFLEKNLKIKKEVYQSPQFNLLKYLGFKDEEIHKTEIFACGTMTVEGAPHLKQEHYPVFDTASKSGALGSRYIHWKAHIDMMAAVQPFISGAISKTINMPNSATIEDIKNAYWLSWEKMLKAVSIYRDGSKLSQPLTNLSPGSDPVADIIVSLMKKNPVDEKTEQKKASPGTKKYRRLLPTRRNGYTQKAKIAGHSLFLRTGEYKDGSLGEIFLDMHKEGAAFRSLLNSFAIAISLGLQYGVPLEEYIDAFTFTRFEPNGTVRGHDNIKMATSVIDFIFRDLALSYLKRSDLVQVKPDDLISTTTTMESKKTAETDRSLKHQSKEEIRSHIARRKGYEGDPCPSCGHFTLIRNGTCLKCDTCGSTTGCS